MASWRRRLRGAFGMGLVWGTAWFLVGLVLLAIVGLDAADVPFPLFFGFLGGVAGAAFSLVLGFVERRRRFEDISMPRFAGWGAVGGLILAGGMGLVALIIGDATPLESLPFLAPLFAAAGAMSAAGSLALARRGSRAALPPEARPERAGATGARQPLEPRRGTEVPRGNTEERR